MSRAPRRRHASGSSRRPDEPRLADRRTRPGRARACRLRQEVFALAAARRAEHLSAALSQPVSARAETAPWAPEIAYRGGALSIEGIPLAAIADEIGTPCYVYSAAQIA